MSTDYRPFRDIAREYSLIRPILFSAESFLTPLLAAAFVGMLVLTAVSIIGSGGLGRRRRHMRRRPVLFCCAALLCALLLYGMTGGFGLLFNLLVFPEIRATHRISLFIAFLLVVSLGILYERAAGRSAARRCVLAVLLALLAAPAVIPFRGFVHAQQQAALKSSHDDRASIAAALSALRTAKPKAILQLPVLPFPEGPRKRTFDGYGHLRPYIMSLPDDKFRWSFGAGGGQEAFLRTQEAALEILSRNTLTARCAGYEAVWVEKEAFAADNLAALEEVLAAQGDLLFADSRRAVFSLAGISASSDQCLHARRLRLDEAIDFTVSGNSHRYVSHGWFEPEQLVRWSIGRSAVLRILLAEKPPGNLRAIVQVQAQVNERHPFIDAEVWVNGRRTAVWHFESWNCGEQTFTIPGELIGENGALEMELRVLNPVSSRKLGLGPDGRVLGVGFARLRLVPE